MSDNPFYQLAPFIQEYIYRNKWKDLGDIQVEAIRAILDGSDHILISSGYRHRQDGSGTAAHHH